MVAGPADNPVPLAYASDTDIAVLTVKGLEFQDWESVFVQLRWNDAFDYCRFTSAERQPNLVPYWPLWQFIPCDDISVTLSGQLAMTGTLVERQVAYDPDSHAIQLLGKGLAMWGYKSTVNTQTGSFDNMPFEAIARKVLEPYGTVNTIGELNPLPFDKVQANPGEKTWDFLENLARPRGIIMASDKLGSFLLIGNRTTSPSATLQEGVNIKTFNMTVNVDDSYLIYKVIGQNAAGSNGMSGGDAAMQESIPIQGTGCKASILTTVAEQPVKGQGELDDRARNEGKWHEGAKVYITIVVQGWTYDGRNLYYPGMSLWVNSPMGPINQPMALQRVTFTQDRNNGSQSSLDLVLPWMLNDNQIPGLNPAYGASPPEQANPQGNVMPRIP